ncbi:MAG: SLC13 family permease [Polyangiaceae bacterium]
MNAWGILIFSLTYLLISAGRVRALGFDRPAGALFGAVACVAFGVLSPEDALGAVDGDTLLLLFGVMGMGAFLARGDFLERLETRLVGWVRTPAGLLGAVVWSAGLLAPLITNDAACVLMAPSVVRLVRRHELPPLPYLLALATAANTGSVATLVGNPQNMLCGLLGGLSYRDHLIQLGPVALMGLAVNHGLLLVFFRKTLPSTALSRERPQTVRIPRRAMLTLAVILGTAAAYALGAHLAWTAAGGFVLLLLLQRVDARELWPRIDWALLLFFTGLFVVVEGLVKSGAPAWLFAHVPLRLEAGSIASGAQLSSVFLIGSNIVSNVPFILLVKDQIVQLPHPTLAWELLAMASTFAGNLTLVGSATNLIVAEAGREVGGVRFIPYLRVGLPIALLTTAIGSAWLIVVQP